MSKNDSSLPEVTILIENPRKSANWGPLLRCCSAFGITQIFCIGYEQCSDKGSHGAAKHVQMTAFHTHEVAQHVLKEELGFHIFGLLQGVPVGGGDVSSSYGKRSIQCIEHITKDNQIEEVVSVMSHGIEEENLLLHDDHGSTTDRLSIPSMVSYPLHQRPFSQRTCIAVGKKTRGLTMSLARICNGFLHIPHNGLPNQEETSTTTTAAWLTLEASVSIALHEFALWAGYGRTASSESNNNKIVHYHGQKYQVDKLSRGGIEEQQRKQEERHAKREQMMSAEEESLMVTFDDIVCGEDGDY